METCILYIDCDQSSYSHIENLFNTRVKLKRISYQFWTDLTELTDRQYASSATHRSINIYFSAGVQIDGNREPTRLEHNWHWIRCRLKADSKRQTIDIGFKATNSHIMSNESIAKQKENKFVSENEIEKYLHFEALVVLWAQQTFAVLLSSASLCLNSDGERLCEPISRQ